MRNDKTPTKLSERLDVISVRLSLLEHKERTGLSWRKLGELMGINGATLHSIATTDYEPKDNSIRRKLNMSTSYRLVVIEGEGVDDLQVLRSVRCECGDDYVSNHPRRKRCFVCSPPRT